MSSDNYYKEGAHDKTVMLAQNNIFTQLSANQIFLSATVGDYIGNDYGTCYKQTDALCLFMCGGGYQKVFAPTKISWKYTGNGSIHAQVSYSGTQTTPNGNTVYVYQSSWCDSGVIHIKVNGTTANTSTTANNATALKLADTLLFNQ